MRLTSKELSVSLVFFSFVSLGDEGPDVHRAYNEWHLYDHRPENLALRGVRWGDRWARPRDYRAISAASAEHESTDYVAMYWFAEPVEASVAEWNTLAVDSFHWGRGPVIPGVSRSLLGFFRPVRGYVAPRVLVAADVLPFRPNQGLHVTLRRFAEPFSAAAHDHHAWEDRVLAPAELAVPGVAGVWTFTFVEYQRLASLNLASLPDDGPGSLRMHLVYLDGEPVATTMRLNEARAHLAEPAVESELLLSTPVRTIVPFQDW
jgi:hypothetical protein